MSAPESQGTLSRRLLAWYSLGALPGGVALGAGSFLVFYYNQVLGVPAATVGLAILAASIFDAVTDPIVGAISDRTRSRMGRRHPYMLASAVPLGIVFTLIWVPPDGLGERGLVAWLVPLLLMQRLLGTFYAVPYLAFGAELTHDYHERTALTTVRAYLSSIGRSLTGAALLLYFLRPTEQYPDGQLNPDAYPPFAILFGLLTAITLFASAWRTRSDGQRLTTVRGPSLSGSILWAPFRDVRDALRYRSFRALTFGVLLQYTAFGVADALGLYVTTFFWGVSTQILFVWGIGMFSGMYVGFDFWRRVGTRLEKRSIYLIGTIGYVASFTAPYVLKVLGWWPSPESWIYLPLYIATTGFVAHFFSAGPTIMTGSMLGDITDLDELEIGRRREGVIFGAESLAYKLFVGIGPVIAGLLIDFAGITPDMQPGEATQSIVVALGLGQGATMAVLLAISLTFLRKYDLTRERHRTIRRVLETRRADPGVLPN
ncbi:MAG: MFS transporter [Deltaproteobacteria bacterium]|nr:MFS transporter [Deltaproteobacteria bacterium]